jgi:glycosyltransferase involved in cell wall biosynthesis
LLVGLGLELSGSGRFLTGLASSLARAGVDVGLFVVRGGPLLPELADSHVDLVVASPNLREGTGRLRLGVAPFFRLVRCIRQAKPDIVHTNLFGLDLIGRVAAFWCRVPVIVSTQHDLNPRPWLVNAYRRATVSHIAATVACSDSVAEYCREVMRVPEDRLFVIENGIDTAPLGEAVAPMSAAPRLLAMGALVAVKGHSVLIEAFARVHEARPDASLTIAGDGPLRAELASLVHTLGLDDAVRLIPPTPDIVGLLRETDVFVQPSLREGLPQAMLEAMAAAKPVVATDVSSHAQVLEDGGCGVLVPPSDPIALAQALLDVIADPDAAATLGRDAQRRVRSRYSLERMSAEYAALYATLLQRHDESGW